MLILILHNNLECLKLDEKSKVKKRKEGMYLLDYPLLQKKSIQGESLPLELTTQKNFQRYLDAYSQNTSPHYIRDWATASASPHHSEHTEWRWGNVYR